MTNEDSLHEDDRPSEQPARYPKDTEYDSFMLGPLIREARLESGLTKRELAERIGMTEAYLSKVERGDVEPEIPTLRKIIRLGMGGKLIFQIKLP